MSSEDPLCKATEGWPQGALKASAWPRGLVPPGLEPPVPTPVLVNNRANLSGPRATHSSRIAELDVWGPLGSRRGWWPPRTWPRGPPITASAWRLCSGTGSGREGKPAIGMWGADAQMDFCFPPKGNEAQSGVQDFRVSQASPPLPTCLAHPVTKGRRAYLA